MDSTVLVIDVGSTRLKAALVTPQGAWAGQAAADSPLRAAPLQAADVLEAVLQVALAACGDHRPGAIVLTGATRTHVLTAADGSALEAVVKLDDTRGADFAAVVQQAYGRPGARGMGAFHPLARLLVWQAVQPRRLAAARWLLELKDWLNLQLTGRACTDQVTYDRLVPQEIGADPLLHRAGLPAGLLPVPMEPARAIGPLRHADSRLAPWQGVPVVQCGFDAWSASYGMGCVHERHVYNVSGTTEVFGSFGTRHAPLDGIDSLRWAPGLYHLGGPCLTGLATLAWFGRQFLGDEDPQAVLDCAAQAGPDVPLCLPFVQGERMPFWRADLRAHFLDVQAAHGRPELARALVDGLMAFQRYLVDRLCPEACTVHLSGGALRLQGWAALKAGMLGAPVAVCTIDEPSLLGGAMAGLAALGHTFGGRPGMEAAQAALAPVPQRVAPEHATRQRIETAAQRLLPHFQHIATQ